MELDDIRQVIELMKENDLAEFEMEHDGLRIRIRRGYEPSGANGGIHLSVGGGAQTVSAGPVPTVPGEEPAGTPAPEEDLLEIVSPIVGTFYRSPSPDSPPYVDIGSSVDEETVVCIVEAMKVMNEIKSEVRGTIVEILVENGSPVEFGQPLFRVRPG